MAARLRAELLETRVTQAVIYGEMIGQRPTTPTPPGHVRPPDTVAPIVTLNALSSSTVSTNQTITGTVTDNAGSAGLSVTVSVDGGQAQTLPINSVGEFAFTTSFALDGTANGLHKFSFVGRDASGNVSAAATTQFTLSTNSSNLTLQLDPASDTGTPGNKSPNCPR